MELYNRQKGYGRGETRFGTKTPAPFVEPTGWWGWLAGPSEHEQQVQKEIAYREEQGRRLSLEKIRAEQTTKDDYRKDKKVADSRELGWGKNTEQEATSKWPHHNIHTGNRTIHYTDMGRTDQEMRAEEAAQQAEEATAQEAEKVAAFDQGQDPEFEGGRKTKRRKTRKKTKRRKKTRKKMRTYKRKKTKRRKTKKRRKKGGARFPQLGQKIKEILDKQKELNGRLHDIEHFYVPKIANNRTNLDLNNDHIIDLAKREGYLRSYINFHLDIAGERRREDPPDAEFETSVDKWAKHIDSHQGEDRADISDYLKGGRKRKSRRKRKRRKKTRKKKENSQKKKDKTSKKTHKKKKN
jgi:hypothetical protein